MLSIRQVAKSVFCHVRHYNILFFKKHYTDLIFQSVSDLSPKMDYLSGYFVSPLKFFSGEYLK